ncbi:hypothetical protein GW17_00038977 [Ensete ventricosum]|nr:hypothetical protein GW17_00038977 [Ensete ventricosum]
MVHEGIKLYRAYRSSIGRVHAEHTERYAIRPRTWPSSSPARCSRAVASCGLPVRPRRLRVARETSRPSQPADNYRPHTRSLGERPRRPVLSVLVLYRVGTYRVYQVIRYGIVNLTYKGQLSILLSTKVYHTDGYHPYRPASKSAYADRPLPGSTTDWSYFHPVIA